MASHYVYSAFNVVGSAYCDIWPGANVSITVTGAGTVVVYVDAELSINHTSGTRDGGEIFMATSNASYGCSNPGAGFNIPSSDPTTVYGQHLSLSTVFPVTGSGSYSFQEYTFTGLGSGVSYYSSTLIATFYPT